MRRIILLSWLCLALALAPSAAVHDGDPGPSAPAKAEEKGPWSPKTFSGLELRSIGPAFMSGRVMDFAVDPANPSRYFVAAASGGVWKTVNAGTTWTPVFDKEGVLLHRLRHPRPQEPQRGLGGDGRAQQPAQRGLRRRHLPLGGRRQELGEPGAEGLRAHRQDPDRPEGFEGGLRRVPGPALGAGRRPRPLQDRRRRQDVESRADDLREHGRHRPRHGPARPRRPLRRGLPAPQTRLHGHQRRPRVGHLQEHGRRRQLEEALGRSPGGGDGPHRDRPLPRRSRRALRHHRGG